MNEPRARRHAQPIPKPRDEKRCDLCDRLLYRLSDGPMYGVRYVEGEERIKPILVVVANLRLLFCRKPCMVEYLDAMPDDVLRSAGWPL